MSNRPRVAHTPSFVFDKIDGRQRDNTAGLEGERGWMKGECMAWGVELRQRVVRGLLA